MPSTSRFWERPPFWIKLSGAFLAVIVVGVIIVNLVTDRIVTEEYARFVAAASLEQAQAAAPLFVAYYDQRGSWEGLETLMAHDQGMGWMMDHSMGNEMMESLDRGTMSLAMIAPTLARNDIVLADEAGRVVLDFDETLLNQLLSPQVLDQGIPLQVSGRRVGTLISGSALARFTSTAQQFLNALKQGGLIAAVAAGLAALALGALLVRQMVRPLNALTRAAERIAAGDLAQRVAIPSRDQLGQLAVAFNAMSEKLKQSEQLRRQMVADVAHELRNPIAVLRGDVEALLDGFSSPARETFQAMDAELQRLTRLVNQLHELSLLEAGEMRLERRSINFPQLLARVADAFRPSAEAKGVSLVTRLQENVLSVNGDTDRLTQVLHNLLSNALRFTPSGGQITVELKRQASDVICSVSDTGPGIAPQDLPWVFERFWRADKSRDRKSGGTGLGLSIAKKLVEAHGGQLGVQSTLGHGATFVIHLPLQNQG